MTSMKLYMHPGACSLSPHIVLRELGIRFDLVEVDRKTHRTADGQDFLGINGNGYVPVLRLGDGSLLTEGPAIVQYLADLRPETDLLPRTGTFKRSQVQSWLNFITSELHKPMAMLFSPALAPSRAALLDLVHKRLRWLETQIAGPWLTGDSFTVADAYLFVCLNWSPWNGVDLESRPALVRFMKQVAARPKVLEALDAEGLGPREAGGIFYGPKPSTAASAGDKAISP
jgi:glutathione S-transferase